MTQTFTATDTVDCAYDPIHLIGSIQSYGHWFAFDPAWRLVASDEDAKTAFGRRSQESPPAQEMWFGCPGDQLFGAELWSSLLAARDDDTGVLPMLHHGVRYAPRWSTSGALRVLELVDESHAEPAPRLEIDPGIAHAKRSEAENFGKVLDRVSELTGYDRIILYRFKSDWSGEVIAERRRDGLPSYLGLHFPENDIPAQARALFVRHRVRMIVDTAQSARPLIAGESLATDRIDLTDSYLRGVAPVHVEYLQNMGVAASLTLSLVKGGELWGMISCHHMQPRQLAMKTVNDCTLLAQTLSVAISAREAVSDERHRRELADNLNSVMENIVASDQPVETAIAQHLGSVRDLLNGSGAAMVLPNTVKTDGSVPAENWLQALRGCLHDEAQSTIVTDSVSASFATMRPHQDAAGLLAVPLDRERDAWLFVLRREYLQEVRWAGDPEQHVSIAEDGSLHPRASFKAWKETVRHCGRAWRPAEVEAARILARLADLNVMQHTQSVLTSQAEMLAASRDPVLVIDLSGLILEWNDKVEARFAARAVGGQRLIDLVDFVSAEEFRRIRQQLRRGEPWFGDYVKEQDEEGEAAFEVSLLPIASKRTEPSAIVAIFRDVSEQRMLERQLRQSQKLESLGQLAGGVAHNFNNHLSVILGYAEFAAEQLDADDPVQSDIKGIVRAARRGASMVHQLLAYSRQQRSERKRMHVGDLINELSAVMSRLVRSEIDFKIDLAPTLPKVDIDPHQFEQVLMNLLVNAQDAIDGPGRIEIRTRLVSLADRRAARVDLTAGDYVIVAVVDSGSGIQPDLMDRIFDPFFTTKEVGKGTGLGLASCLGIVEKHGGTLRVESTLGEGSTFHVYLPVASDQSETVEVSEVFAGGDGAETILMVDDEAALRGILKRGLESHGYTVLLAEDGQSALDVVAARDGEIDLLVTDVVMPGMRGSELAAKVRALHPAIPVILVSGYGEEMLESTERQVAADEILAKPFSVAELRTKVRRVLDDAARGRETLKHT